MADFLLKLLEGIGNLNDTAEGRMNLRQMAGQDLDYNTQLYKTDLVAGENQLKRAQAGQEAQALQELSQQDFSQGFNPDVMGALIAAGRVDDAIGYYKAANKQSAQQQKAQALIAQGYNPKIATDISLGVIKDAVDERGRPIRMNMATGEILPIGGGSAPMQGSYTTTFEMPVSDMVDGGAPTIDGDITTSDIPSIDSVASELGLHLTNPTDAKTAERVFKSRMAGNKNVADKQINLEAIGSSFNNFEQQYTTQKQAIAEAKKKIARGGATGLINQLTGWIGSSPSGSLNTDLEVLQANAFLDALTELKKASPTGATGLGGVTEAEGERIVKSRGNLEGQSKAENLLRYLDNYEKTLDNAYVNITKRTQKVAPNIFQQQEMQRNAPLQIKRLKYNPATGDFE